jgi:hypothetical protein
MTPVKIITYKGQKYPVRVSYYCIKKFEEETGKKLEQLDSEITLLEVLLWYALVAGHTAEGIDLVIPRSEMEFVLDECMSEFNDAILSFFPIGGETSDDPSKKN